MLRLPATQCIDHTDPINQTNKNVMQNLFCNFMQLIHDEWSEMHAIQMKNDWPCLTLAVIVNQCIERTLALQIAIVLLY